LNSFRLMRCRGGCMSRMTCLAFLVIAALAAACDGSSKTAKPPTSPDAPGALVPKATGILEVKIKGGNMIPRTGYIVIVDGSMSLSGQTDFSVMFPGLSAGDHSVEVRVVSTVCRATGDNPRKVFIAAASTVVAEFEVACNAGAPAR